MSKTDKCSVLMVFSGAVVGRERWAQKTFFLLKQNKQGKTVMQAIKKSTAGQGVRGSLTVLRFRRRLSAELHAREDEQQISAGKHCEQEEQRMHKYGSMIRVWGVRGPMGRPARLEGGSG